MKIRITKNHVDALCVLIGVQGMGSLYFQVLRMPLMAAMLIASILLLTRAHHPKISVQNVRLTLLLTAALLLTAVKTSLLMRISPKSFCSFISRYLPFAGVFVFYGLIVVDFPGNYK